MPHLSNGVYDILNRIVKYALPAFGTAYFGLAQIWGFPYGEEVVGSIVVIATFFGVVLAISSAQYDAELKNEEAYPDTTLLDEHYGVDPEDLEDDPTL